ncbi:hypothetical protein NCS52_00413900 [Fusarium sp. LHS14.1]|nr:hypothetical protein NCS52_00413900 [Fusarium sp. LHS14.1]
MTEQNDNVLPTSTPPPTDNDPLPFTRQAMMQFLQFPDSFGVAHSFYQFDKELQRMLQALAPWQLSLLGFHVAFSQRWNDEALQQDQEDAMLELIPEALMPLTRELCFSEPEDIPDTQVVDFPMDAWCWLFRQDPFKPRQPNAPPGLAPSAEPAMLSPERLSVIDEESEPSSQNSQ